MAQRNASAGGEGQASANLRAVWGFLAIVGWWSFCTGAAFELWGMLGAISVTLMGIVYLGAPAEVTTRVSQLASGTSKLVIAGLTLGSMLSSTLAGRGAMGMLETYSGAGATGSVPTVLILFWAANGIGVGFVLARLMRGWRKKEA